MSHVTTSVVLVFVRTHTFSSYVSLALLPPDQMQTHHPMPALGQAQDRDLHQTQNVDLQYLQYGPYTTDTICH